MLYAVANPPIPSTPTTRSSTDVRRSSLSSTSVSASRYSSAILRTISLSHTGHCRRSPTRRAIWLPPLPYW